MRIIKKIIKAVGIMLLLIQKRTKGLLTIARKGKRDASRIYEYEWKAIVNPPKEKPINRNEKKLVSPWYSGDKNRYDNPKPIPTLSEIRKKKNTQ
jgi:hypothetical protein